MALGRAAGHVERKVRRVLEDLVAGARGAQPRDDAAPPAALGARHLRLREHPREDLLLHDAHAASAAVGARVYVPVCCGARAAAVVAEHTLFDDELVVRKKKVSIGPCFAGCRFVCFFCGGNRERRVKETG